MKKYLATAILLLTIVISSKAQVELISGGTGAAYTLSVPGVFSLRNGIQVTFKAHINSSATATMNVSGTGAVSIMKDGGSSSLAIGDIKNGQIVTLAYDGAKWQMMNPVGTPTAPTNYWSPNGSDIFNNNTGNVLVDGANFDGAYKVSFGKNASSVEKVLSLTNQNNFVGGGTSLGFRSNFGGTMWDQALISGITGASSASGDLAFSVMNNRTASTIIEAMRIQGSTGNIGIGTSSPTEKLHVTGGQIYSNWASPNGPANVFISNWNSGSGPGYNTGTLGQVTIATSDAAESKYAIQGYAGGDGGSKIGITGSAMGLGNNTGGYFSASGGTNNYAIIVPSTGGNVGIGTTAPSTTLDVANSTIVTTSRFMNTFNGASNTAVYGGTTGAGTGTNYGGAFESSGSPTNWGVYGRANGATGTNIGVYGIANQIGGVGIHIGGYFSASGGATNNALQLVDGSQANNRVLTSDASGIATWKDLTAISSGSTAWTRVTPNIYPTTLTDNVGIGLASPTTKFQIHSTSGIGNLRLTGASTGALSTDGFSMSNDGSNVMYMTQHENADWYFSTNGGTLGMIIKPTGNVGIGTSTVNNKLDVEGAVVIGANYSGTNTAPTNGLLVEGKIGIGITDPIEILEIGSTDSDIELETYSTTESSSLHIKRGRGTLAVPAIPILNDYYGGVGFQAWNGTAFQEGARIQGVVDGAVAANDMPGRLEFHTSPDGTATAVERMRITNGGNVGIGTTLPDGILHVAETKAVYDGSDGAYAFIQNSDATANNGQLAGIKFRTDGVGAGTNARYKGGIVFQKTGSWGVGDLLFLTNSVGSNASVTAADERMRITSTGNVGIGITVPNRQLEIGNTSSSIALYSVGFVPYVEANRGVNYAPRLNMGTLGSGQMSFEISNDGFTSSTTEYVFGTSQSGLTFRSGVDNQKSLGTATFRWTAVYALNGTIQTSDAREKKNIHSLDYGLIDLMKLKPVSFEWKYENMKGTHLGFIAQDVKDVIKEVVTNPIETEPQFVKDENGKQIANPNYVDRLGVAYSELIPVLVKSIQEQQKMIEELKREVEALKNK